MLAVIKLRLVIYHSDVLCAGCGKSVKYFNPIYNSPSANVPVTRLCTQIADEKKDLWISVMGCVADKYYPDFYLDFFKIHSNNSRGASSCPIGLNPWESRYFSVICQSVIPPSVITMDLIE